MSENKDEAMTVGFEDVSLDVAGDRERREDAGESPRNQSTEILTSAANASDGVVQAESESPPEGHIHERKDHLEPSKQKMSDSAAVDEIAVTIKSHDLEKYYRKTVDPNATFYQKYILPAMNKGNISNLITFTIMLIGLILTVTLGSARSVAAGTTANVGQYFAQYILALGLFGFAGGITNWLAVKMLFDKIPGLIGSGIIPARFKEIRESVKIAIMKTFFDPEFLKKYVEQKSGQLIAHFNLEEKIKKVLESETVDQLIDTKLNELASRPEGMWLAMMGTQPAAFKPLIKPFVLGMGGDMAPLMLEMINPSKMLNVEKLRKEIDRLMTTKLQELTPTIVKRLMEEVIRRHLGWLIVWGNVFGGFIGILSNLIGY